MALSSDLLAKDDRIQEAYRNRNRPIAFGELQSISVARIQWALSLLGYALPQSITTQGVDGIFGPETLAVVRKFQADQKRLRVDGMVGQHTLDALDAGLGKLPKPVPPVPGPGGQTFPADLRILCRFSRASPELGDTFGGPTETNPLLGKWRQDFILLNSLKLGADNCSLLHEMIHATGLSVHDTDPTSVFFGSGDARRILRPEHAKRLSGRVPGAPVFFAQQR